jgi:hypothetical protein
MIHQRLTNSVLKALKASSALCRDFSIDKKNLQDTGECHCFAQSDCDPRPFRCHNCSTEHLWIDLKFCIQQLQLP